LISRVDDQDEVAIDEDITSSEDEDGGEKRGKKLSGTRTIPIMKNRRLSGKSSESTWSGKTYAKLTAGIPKVATSRLPIPKRSTSRINSDDVNEVKMSRDIVNAQKQTSQHQIMDTTSQIRNMQIEIDQKEQLIVQLQESQKQVQHTGDVYKNKLTKLEKDVEKATKELEDARQKISTFEKSNSKDAKEKTKRGSEC
jgi:TolA-binding protein